MSIDEHLHVREKIGRALIAIEICRALLYTAEHQHRVTAHGHVVPDAAALATLRLHVSAAYPAMTEMLQHLGAGGLLMMPSVADFASPVAADVERYYQGRGTVSASDRVGVFKLAWDLCGDGFGQRAVQFERFYAGDPVRRTARLMDELDLETCRRLVARALDGKSDPR